MSLQEQAVALQLMTFWRQINQELPGHFYSKVYITQSINGQLLPWDNFLKEQQAYEKYLLNTDTIMKHDLQQGIFRILSGLN